MACCVAGNRSSPLTGNKEEELAEETLVEGCSTRISGTLIMEADVQSYRVAERIEARPAKKSPDCKKAVSPTPPEESRKTSRGGRGHGDQAARVSLEKDATGRGGAGASTVWNEIDLICSGSIVSRKYGVIALNSPLPAKHIKLISELWRSSPCRVAVDGGLNYIRNLAPNLSKEEVRKTNPHYLIGDMDSVSPMLVTALKKDGTTKIRLALSQDDTDFVKALRILAGEVKQTVPGMVVIGGECGFAGRIDHALANFDGLLRAQYDWKGMKIVMFHGDAVAFMLRPGRNIITISKQNRGTWCGLIPLVPCEKVSTDGFRWNIMNLSMRMGKLISSSNEAVSEKLTVETTDPLLFVSGLPPKMAFTEVIEPP